MELHVVGKQWPDSFFRSQVGILLNYCSSGATERTWPWNCLLLSRLRPALLHVQTAAYPVPIVKLEPVSQTASVTYTTVKLLIFQKFVVLCSTDVFLSHQSCWPRTRHWGSSLGYGYADSTRSWTVRHKEGSGFLQNFMLYIMDESFHTKSVRYGKIWIRVQDQSRASDDRGFTLCSLGQWCRGLQTSGLRKSILTSFHKHGKSVQERRAGARPRSEQTARCWWQEEEVRVVKAKKMFCMFLKKSMILCLWACSEGISGISKTEAVMTWAEDSSVGVHGSHHFNYG